MVLKKKKPLKKALKKKIVKKKAPAKKRTVKSLASKKKIVIKGKKDAADVIGVVTHYFPKVRAAVIKLKAPLAVGSEIKIKGHTTDFTQNVVSMQIDHVVISKAKKGDEIGLLVDSRVREYDVVTRV
jgi:hypothetical protein